MVTSRCATHFSRCSAARDCVGDTVGSAWNDSPHYQNKATRAGRAHYPFIDFVQMFFFPIWLLPSFVFLDRSTYTDTELPT